MVTDMHESSTYRAILEEGATRGEVRNAQRNILDLGGQRFGPPDAASAATIEALDSIDVLNQVIHRLLTATSWQDLLTGVDR